MRPRHQWKLPFALCSVSRREVRTLTTPEPFPAIAAPGMGRGPTMAGINSNRTIRSLLLWAAPTRSLVIVALAGSLSAMVAFAPTPLAERLIEVGTRDSAMMYEARILREFTAGGATFPRAACPKATAWPRAASPARRDPPGADPRRRRGASRGQGPRAQSGGPRRDRGPPAAGPVQPAPARRHISGPVSRPAQHGRCRTATGGSKRRGPMSAAGLTRVESRRPVPSAGFSSASLHEAAEIRIGLQRGRHSVP